MYYFYSSRLTPNSNRGKIVACFLKHLVHNDIRMVPLKYNIRYMTVGLVLGYVHPS